MWTLWRHFTDKLIIFVLLGSCLQRIEWTEPKGEKTTALVDSYEILFDSGPLISGSLCISLRFAQSFFSLPLPIFLSLLLIPPNLPFTHILLSTSLSCCAMVARSLQFPAAMKTPRLFNSGAHHSSQLDSQNRVCLTAAPLKRGFLQSQTSWKYLSGGCSLPFSIATVPSDKLFIA